MASHNLSSAIFVLSLLVLATFTTACDTCKPPKPKPKPKPKPCPTPSVPTPSVPTPSVPTPSVPTPSVPTPSVPEKCPRDTLKLGACADLLGLVNVVVGSSTSSKCCAVLDGLVDLEAALCLCTAIKANVLGINLDVPVTLGLLLSACEKSLPEGFKC